MPRKAKHTCNHPGCNRLTEERFCEQHRREGGKAYERYGRDPATRRRYGRAWKRIRDRYYLSHPYCELCYKRGVMTPAEEVHHILPLAEGGTHDRNNLMSLCKSCHAKIHGKRGDRKNKNKVYTY